jgi:galactokinase
MPEANGHRPLIGLHQQRHSSERYKDTLHAGILVCSRVTFSELYGRPPAAHGEAPGRVNLMGEHTDYNGGFVLPAAIPRRTIVDLAPREDRIVRVWSAQFPDLDPIEYRLGEERRRGDWIDYVQGLTWVLASDGVGTGFDARIESTVPLGSGLSSSAALEIALGRALREAFQLQLDDVTLAVRGRRVETDFVGAPIGIMDQMACSLADTTSALFLDTRSLTYSRVPLPSGSALIVIDSGVTHRHAGGEYAMRREECGRAAALLNVTELRDVPIDDLDRVNALPEPLNRRARHVVTENARVLETVRALEASDLSTAGRLFLESHVSMRDDFAVSIPPIDALVELARGASGIYGVRLTGGGFGGSVVALAERSKAAEAARMIVDTHNLKSRASARVLVP